MKIAITGATGFLGRYIVDHLANSGHVCQCWYRPTSDLGGFDAPKKSITWVPGEMGDRKATLDLIDGCDAVVHAALDHPGGGFRGDEGELVPFLERNLIGTIRLIELARSSGIGRFVFISTCAVHDVVLDDRPLDETHPLWPKSHYGAHKAAIEAFVSSFGRGQGYPICALRPTGIYGLARPARSSKWAGLISQVVRGEPVDCRRGGKEVHAHDVARAVEILLRADHVSGEAYSCYDRYISEFEVATIAKRLTGSASPISGEAPSPRHQIVTEKLQALGMTFGGIDRLESTLKQILAALGQGAR
jgi:nucleoside-diphosphate-sugar epimerase